MESEDHSITSFLNNAITDTCRKAPAFAALLTQFSTGRCGEQSGTTINFWICFGLTPALKVLRSPRGVVASGIFQTQEGNRIKDQY
jgi:hypothetical protein